MTRIVASALALLALASPAGAQLKVVTSTTDLGAIAK